MSKTEYVEFRIRLNTEKTVKIKFPEGLTAEEGATVAKELTRMFGSQGFSAMRKIEEKGRVHIPKDILTLSGLKPGTKVVVSAGKGCVIIHNERPV